MCQNAEWLVVPKFDEVEDSCRIPEVTIFRNTLRSCDTALNFYRAISSFCQQITTEKVDPSLFVGISSSECARNMNKGSLAADFQVKILAFLLWFGQRAKVSKYQTLEGSFSAVSAPIFASEYSFCSVFRDLPETIRENASKLQNFEKTLAA